VRLALHNDTDDPWEARVRLRRVALRGGVLAEASIELAVEPRGVRTVAVGAPLATPEDPLAELLIADEGGQRAVYAFGRDRDLAYAPAAFDAALETRGPDHRLTVTARAVLRDLTLQPDRLEPSSAADDALVTLVPGERHTFVITSPTPLTLEDLTRTPVLWCANDLLTPREGD
jgi:beta-mannosidase